MDVLQPNLSSQKGALGARLFYLPRKPQLGSNQMVFACSNAFDTLPWRVVVQL